MKRISPGATIGLSARIPYGSPSVSTSRTSSFSMSKDIGIFLQFLTPYIKSTALLRSHESVVSSFCCREEAAFWGPIGNFGS